VRDFTLTNPDRIVVDITGARLGVRRGRYDGAVRGGVLDVRYAQNQPNVVRVVLTLAGPKKYQVTQNKGEIRVAVEGAADFTAWRVGRTYAAASAPALATAPSLQSAPRVVRPASRLPLAAARAVVDTPPPPGITAQVTSVATPDTTPTTAPLVQQRPLPQQPRITIAWENANIRDVLAAFAAFSGRTIIPAKGVEGTITAEIIDKPWDVAMKAILNANGFDAIEDANGIIIVNTIEAIANAAVQRPRLENLTTTTVRFNYVSAHPIADALRARLSRDCGALAPSIPAAAPAGTQQQTTMISSPLNCPVRGAVTADTLSNTVSITDVPSALPALIQYAQSLDVRQPQVNIKAKIILVDRTQLEALGLKYDLGSRVQHFNDLVTRLDSLGNPETGNRIFLGGNAVSAIANAQTAVPTPTLRIIYSAAIGGFQFTTFMDALQDQSLLDVQAEPSVTTLNYRQAVLSAGTQVPVRTIEPGTGGNAQGAFPTVTVQMRQTGIVLRVTPSITNNRQIKMAVHAENSDVAFQGGDVGAVFPTQSLDNELLVADGETAVMGGLTQTSVRVTKTGLPLLIDLPLIGRLFGITNRSETKRDLLILITPHIVDEGDMTMEPRRSP
jgi:type IV pilus assembly protein PilQ